MIRILVTGRHGQVGFELQRSLAVLGEVIAVGREDCDLSDPAAIEEMLARVKPQVIVNPAAYTAVDRAETERDQAFAINATAPRVLAEAAARSGALLVHYSTDYVFDGDKSTAYSESDVPQPRSVYGQSKLAGEAAIIASGAQYVIFRTSWLYGAYGNNFARTILRLAARRESLKIVADQFGAPTPASMVADITAQVLGIWLKTKSPATFPFGVYHLAAAGETSWHDYATTVLTLAKEYGMQLRLDAQSIEPIPTAGYPLPAPRPANSRLSTSKLNKTFGLVAPDWREPLAYTLKLMIGEGNS